MQTRERIFELRSLLKMDRSQFAKALGYTYRSIYYYETGQRKPCFQTCHKMIALARKHGLNTVSLEWLRPEM